MGNFRFYRRFRIFPGLSVNISKTGPSLTVGVRGAHVTVSPHHIQRTVGIPGSGIYYTSTWGTKTGFHSSHVDVPVAGWTQTLAHIVAGVLTVAAIVFVAIALLALLTQVL